MEKFYPEEKNIQKPCYFWAPLGDPCQGCNYPQARMTGELFCRGIIDEWCLALKNRQVGKYLQDNGIAFPLVEQEQSVSSPENPTPVFERTRTERAIILKKTG